MSDTLTIKLTHAMNRPSKPPNSAVWRCVQRPVRKFCENCDHGKSMGIFQGSPVACGKHNQIKHWGDYCPDWKLIFSSANKEITQ